jgi:transcriptional regulator with XRE-family HTH domain
VAKSQFAFIYGKVPQLLVEMRVSAGLTQRQLAAQMGKSQSWVFKSEAASRRIDIAEFLEWCRGCGVEPVEAFKRLIRPN